MARCSRRAMRPAVIMGAFYRAMLDALVRSEWRDPTADRPVEAAEALAGAAPRDFMTARSHSGGKVHVVGAGLAGLAASVALADDGRQVVLYEAGAHAGGRCRSFIDSELGVRIDNGNHLLLPAIGRRSPNRADRRARYVRTAGRSGNPVRRLRTGERWEVRPVARSRAVVDFSPVAAGAGDAIARLRRRAEAPAGRPRRYGRGCTGSRHKAVSTVMGAAGRRGAQHIGRAGVGRLFSRVVSETIGSGAVACRPMLARDGLSESLVDPALDYLSRKGGEICFGSRLKEVGFAAGYATELRF